MSGLAGSLRVTAGAVGVGLASGAASAGFLRSLEWVTDVHSAHPALIWLLPLGGVVTAWVQLRWGGRATQGNRLTMSQIHRLDAGVPLRMAPLVWLGTLVTHVFGGSAGREGTALQMAAGLTDGVAARTGWSDEDRRLLLVAALAGGFGSVFGVPWAGVVFALEVAPVSWADRARVAPAAVVAALLGNATVGWLGVHHAAYVEVAGVASIDVMWCAAAAPAFGLAAWGFVRLTEGVKQFLGRRMEWAPLRPVIGGAVVVAATLLIGTRSYNGLSLPLLGQALGGQDVDGWAWAAKLAFTAVTVGSGFAGGEVTPLFVVGATLGAGIGNVTGAPVALLAAVGMMATFGSAANATLACVVMGVELFGWDAAVPLLVGCVIARWCSSSRSLYQHEHEPIEEGIGLI